MSLERLKAGGKFRQIHHASSVVIKALQNIASIVLITDQQRFFHWVTCSGDECSPKILNYELAFGK
jgi:hypothetical protein